MTPDSFPIFDRFLENVYMIADANHGYKMIGVGELVAKEILGTESDLLKPFRFNRYEKGELHPTSDSTVTRKVNFTLHRTVRSLGVKLQV